MRFIRNIFNRLAGTIILIATALLLHSCVDDHFSETSKESTFTLTLSVLTESTGATRASHSDDYEEVGSEAENHIDIDGNDMRIFLFTAGGEFLQEVTGITWEKSTIANGLVYTMPEKEIFFSDETDEEKAVIESIKRDGIHVLVLANSRNTGWAGTGSSLPKLDDLWKNGTAFNFNYIADGTTTWLPSITTSPKKLIPMFGFIKANFFQTATGKNKSFGSVKMQRAMAKIEVYDDIITEGVSISGVTMSDYNRIGRLIPDLQANPNWDVIGEQVTESSLPTAPNHTNTPLTFFHTPGEKVWVAYVPEMALDKPQSDGTLSDERTHLNVTISAPENSGFNGAVFPLHFAKYENNVNITIPDDSWNHILRNHIYRFSVMRVGVSAELEMHVVPWTLDEDEDWDFTDHVSISKMLDWNINSYESLDTETGRLLLWIDDDKDKILTGSFIIKTPVNGRWYARLTPLDDAKPNAITFVDSNGATMEPSYGDPPVCLEISGVIEQEVPAYIRIRPTDFGNDDMSAFKLEFFVENLGVWINVPMVKDEYEFPYYIIVRKGNKIDY